MSKKKKESKKKSRVHKELEGFEIKINPLGEITSNYNIDQINEFLNRNVRDKKLVDKDAPEEEEFPIAAADDEEEEPEDAFLESPLAEEEEDLPLPKRKNPKATDQHDDDTEADTDQDTDKNA